MSVIEPLAAALDTTPAYIAGWTNDSYNWDKDIEHRMDSIPDAIREELLESIKAIALQFGAIGRRWSRMPHKMPRKRRRK